MISLHELFMNWGSVIRGALRMASDLILRACILPTVLCLTEIRDYPQAREARRVTAAMPKSSILKSMSRDTSLGFHQS